MTLLIVYILTLPVTAAILAAVMYLRANPPKRKSEKVTEVIYLPAIRRVVEDQQLFLRPHLNIEQVAREVGTNASYVSRAINQGMGISFRDYIIRLRIGYALTYREARPDAPVSELAAACGYEDPATFARHYRNITGSNPSSK